MTYPDDQLQELHDLQWAIFRQQLQLHTLVDTMRDDGISWTLIGRALGITKQAAQQRFNRPAPGQLF
jgi:hypothetical protein